MGQPQKLTLSCSIVCLPLGHYNKLQPSGDFILIHIESTMNLRGNVLNLSKYIPKSSQRMKEDMTKHKQTELD